MHMRVLKTTVGSYRQHPRAIARNRGPQSDQPLRQCKIEKADIHEAIDFVYFVKFRNKPTKRRIPPKWVPCHAGLAYYRSG